MCKSVTIPQFKSINFWTKRLKDKKLEVVFKDHSPTEADDMLLMIEILKDKQPCENIIVQRLRYFDKD